MLNRKFPDVQDPHEVAADPPVSESALSQKITDTFIHQRTPQWIKAASVADIRTLRKLYLQHKTTQQQVSAATAAAVTPHAFADTAFSEAFANLLPDDQPLKQLLWQDKVYKLEGFSVPRLEPEDKTQPALARLMQNFAENATPLDGSGLVAVGSNTVLSGDVGTFIATCRRLDVGARYQTEQDSIFEKNAALLMEDKLAGFKLAVQIAFLKGAIKADVRDALLASVSDSAQANGETTTAATAVPARPGDAPVLTAYPGLMSMLGVRVHEALFAQLRGVDDQDDGIVVYLPGQPEPLRWFASKLDWVKEMAGSLKHDDQLAAFIQLIALEDRAAFFATLQLRLKDDEPDLEVEGDTHHEPVFKRWVDEQIERVKADARLLLVPTADADAKASRERLEAWASLGWGLASLAGFFIPVVGALLLAHLVTHVCKDVFEGVEDWAQGHDHEALQHVLNVAETVAAAAVTTAVAAGAGAAASAFVRSAFVDGLEPVGVGPDTQRLWSDDLTPYQTSGEGATLEDDGLYHSGARRLLRIDEHYYEVHQAEEQGPWRLQHPLRPTAYGPVVEGNGERFWRVRGELPQAWNDEAKLLDRLWPQERPLDPQQARRVLQAACSDVDELRGIAVENRALPANLRDTLRRFEADERIERFFGKLPAGAPFEDQVLLEWCKQRPEFAGMDGEPLHVALEENASHLRSALFRHLTETQPSTDQAAQVIRREFAGLPHDYVSDLVNTLSASEREVIEIRRRLPLSVSQRARSLLQLARLNRAQQGLMLRNAYVDGAGELAFNLFARVDHWPLNTRLELRKGSSSGRLLAVLNPQSPEATQHILVHLDGQFRLYDHRGLELEAQPAEPDDFFQAIHHLLTPSQRDRLELDQAHPVDALRQRVLSKLPGERQRLVALLGQVERKGWFNPGQRLPDGRVGYPLGGGTSNQSGAYRQLRRRLAALYHGDSPERIQDHMERVLDTEDPFEQLVYEEQNLQMLESRLSQWVSAAPEPELAARRQVSERLRAAWRRQLDIDMEHQAFHGRILDLSGCPVSTLPELTRELDFHFVTSMVMVNTPLQVVPESFFSCFAELQRLNLSRNGLQALPAGIRQLGQLRRLQLSYNRIRWNDAATSILGELHNLVSLDLSFNPLRTMALRFARVPALRRLQLMHCGLLEWPEGLQQCSQLRIVNLNSNVLSDIPDAIMQMPYEFRASIQLERNAIQRRRLELLYARPAHPMHDPYVAEGLVPSARALWVTGEQAEARGARWDRLFPGHADAEQQDSVLRILSDLRESADFRNMAYREVLTRQVWSVLDAMDADAQLAQELHSIADDPVTCADSVAERFADLQLRVLVANAERAAPGQRDELLKLGSGMFRLQTLEAFIHEDIEQRLQATPDLDQIEARLYYIVNLAAELQLPGQPASMRFSNISGGNAYQLAKALAYVNAAETVEAKARFLSEQAFWTTWLQSHYPDEFAAVTDELDTLGVELDEARETLSDGEYKDRWDALAADRAARLSRLKILLTTQVLGTGQTSHPD
ncbi:MULTISPECIES: NEL-type E3 ubiquitin ligase domain-containing protein [Pseudomonas]|uniref:NEL-type E3 ubiquitin ligase domain-containing protein n=1 Tax=Pseudomonas TaxID=286 RepID=UPI0015968157|nr:MULTISPECIES: NEL-type E3 ubiquitin ligase domain-containing protein [Pseudomonas]